MLSQAWKMVGRSSKIFQFVGCFNMSCKNSWRHTNLKWCSGCSPLKSILESIHLVIFILVSSLS